MNKLRKSSFVEGTFIATAAIFFTKLLGLFYVIPFYAMVGNEGSSLYAYTYNIYVIFLDIATVGLPIAISKVINEYYTLGENDNVSRTYYLSKRIMFGISVIIFCILMLCSNLIASFLLKGVSTKLLSDLTITIRVVALSILIVPLLSVEKGVLQGFKVINICSISQIIEQIVRISIILGSTYIILYILKLPMVVAISFSILGSFIGGIVAYIYVLFNVRKGKLIEKDIVVNKDKNKLVIKKIFKYAIPFIIVNIISSLYNFVDMSILIKSLKYLKYDGKYINYVTSSICTWAPKINMIVTCIAMGMSMSLIPTVVHEYTLGNYKEVNKKFNQALQIIIFISIPMVVGISYYSKYVWDIFYGYNKIGSIILKYNVFLGLFINLFMVSSSQIQGLNKFKIVYLSTGIGFLVNILLDGLLVISFFKLNVPCYLGTIFSSFIGYGISIGIILISLKKEIGIKYGNTLKVLFKEIIYTLIMIIALYLFNKIFVVNKLNRIKSIVYVIINATFGGVIYITLNWRFKVIEDIFGNKKLIFKR